MPLKAGTFEPLPEAMPHVHVAGITPTEALHVGDLEEIQRRELR